MRPIGTGWTKSFGDFWRVYRRNRAAVVGLLILAFFIAIAIVGPWIAPYSPMKAGVGPQFAQPSSQFLMGTDDLGRDIFSEVLCGTRTSLLVGVLASISTGIIGLVIGCISGFNGGWIDDLLMRLTEFYLSIPTVVLALVMVVFVGPTIWNIVIVIALVMWPSTARLVRAEFLSLKEKEFAEAAKAMGYSNKNIMFAEILPNAIAPVIVNTTLQMASAILTEATLSFLGAGDVNTTSWGQVLSSGRMFLRRAPWIVVFPAITLVLLVLSINLMGDGLSDALNPKRRK